MLADASGWDQPLEWFLFGLVGQLMFFSRFLVQWIVSERAGRSIVPMGFWYLSIAGGLITLIYAVYRQEVIWVLGQAFGTMVYVRNIRLRKLESKNG